MMKVVVHSAFGPADELRLDEVETPIPAASEILIRVHATTVTSSDCNARNLTFAPAWARIPMRLFLHGVFRPRKKQLGIELAGEVVAVGEEVTRFRPGDEVFGSPGPALGAHAEFLCVPEDAVFTIKPAAISWTDVASLTLAGNTALYFLRDLASVQAGQTVLINGASGGIGTYAVQLAKYFGAKVVAVCSAANGDLVRSIGADEFIDYHREDFAARSGEYDVVFDVVGSSSFSDCSGSLTHLGIYLTALPSVKAIVQSTRRPSAGGKTVKFGDAVPTVENLDFLKQLVQEGTLKPVIDRQFSLEQIADAYAYAETGHKRGNVIVSLT